MFDPQKRHSLLLAHLFFGSLGLGIDSRLSEGLMILRGTIFLDIRFFDLYRLSNHDDFSQVGHILIPGPLESRKWKRMRGSCL